MGRTQESKMTSAERRYCSDLWNYSNDTVCDYRQLLKNKRAAVKYLFEKSETKQIIVSSKNWVELEGFCLTGISYETLKSLIPIEKANLIFLI